MDPNTAALRWTPVETFFGDLYPVELFDPKTTSPQDGSGYWATSKHYAPDVSVFSYPKPEWATHVMWFNK